MPYMCSLWMNDCLPGPMGGLHPYMSLSDTRNQWCRNQVQWINIELLQWRHNGLYGVPNHQPHDCLFNLSFRRRSKKTSTLCVPALCAGNSSVTGEVPQTKGRYHGKMFPFDDVIMIINCLHKNTGHTFLCYCPFVQGIRPQRVSNEALWWFVFLAWIIYFITKEKHRNIWTSRTDQFRYFYKKIILCYIFQVFAV